MIPAIPEDGRGSRCGIQQCGQKSATARGKAAVGTNREGHRSLAGRRIVGGIERLRKGFRRGSAAADTPAMSCAVDVRRTQFLLVVGINPQPIDC
jgi:hypothetical protein